MRGYHDKEGMSEDNNTILVLSDVVEQRQIIFDVLEEQSYRIITAVSGNEARLKYSNEPFKMLILDMDVKGFNAREFILSIRRKEEFKNRKDMLPILLTGYESSIFSRDYADLDNVKFLDKPFSPMDVKKRLLSFTGQANVIAENTKQIKADEYLITEGGTSNEMFWVLEGSFVITKLNCDNNNVIIGEVNPGELVGEMSFLDELPRSASVKAKEDSEVLVIPHKKFIDVLDGQPRWFRSLMRTLSQRLRNANQMIARKNIEVDFDPGKDDESEF